MKVKIVVGLIGLILALNGCKTLSKSECNTGDWESIGYSDGFKGEKNTRVELHQEACSKHGVQIDHGAYIKGYDAGVVLFCTAKNGYDVGLIKKEYLSVCPVELEEDFLMGYNDGKAINAMQTKVWRAGNKIDSHKKDQAKYQDHISAYKKEMLLDETTQTRRIELFDLIEEREELIEELQVLIDTQIIEKTKLEAELADMLEAASIKYP